MNRITYQSNLTTLYLLAGMVKEIPLREMLAAADHSMGIGPILDPTLWRQNHQKLQEDIELMRAVLPLHTLAQKIAPEEEKADVL